MSRGSESEERLLIEAAQKDPGRFAELYEQNFHRVYAYIARRVSDRDETQDLTAHVFQQALANLGKVQMARSALYYLALPNRFQRIVGSAQTSLA